MKCKIFEGTYLVKVQREVNEFISNKIEIKHIVQSYYEQDKKDNYTTWKEYGIVISIFYVDSE